MQQKYRLPLLVICVLTLIICTVLLKVPEFESEEDSREAAGDEEPIATLVSPPTPHQAKLKPNRAPKAKEYFLIAAGISSNHFLEGKEMIRSVQKYLPTRRIVMYDLGLTKGQRKELKRLRNVKLRTFNFNQYPPYFRSLRKYAWKPFVIRTLAREAEYLFWSDASIRFSKDFETSLSKLGKFPVKGHHLEFDVIQVTHNGTLDYFNMTRESMRNVAGIGSEMVLFKTNEVAMHILDLWCDCAIHEECIAPKAAVLLPCNFKIVKKGSVEYIGCHRYDQSALNVVIVKEYGTKVYKYILDSPVDKSLAIVKRPH